MGAMHSTSGGAGDGLRDAALNADAAGAADAAAASGPEHAAQEARRIVKVTPARLKAGGNADAGAAGGPGLLPQQQRRRQQPASAAASPVAGSKRKATAEPGSPAADEARKLRMWGTTMFILGMLQGMEPFQPAQGTEQQQPEQQQQPEKQQQQQQQQPQPAEPLNQGEEQQHGLQQQKQGEGTPAAILPSPPGWQRADEAGAAPSAAPAAATPMAQPRQPPEEAGEGEDAPHCTPQPVAVPLSAAKPVSRSQLRQQLQLRSQRPVGEPAARAAGQASSRAPLAAAVAGSTRGHRLLELACPLQHAPGRAAEAAAAQADALGAVDAEGQGDVAALPTHPSEPAVVHAELSPAPGAPAAAEAAGAACAAQPADAPEEAGPTVMEVDAPSAGLELAEAAPAVRPAGAAPPGRLAQRRLSQLHSREAAARQQALDADAGAGTPPSAPLAEEPAAVLTGDSTPPKLRVAGGTRASAAAGGAAFPAPLCASPQPLSPQQEGDVQAALQQVGRLLVDLRGDSPQPPKSRGRSATPEPAAAADRPQSEGAPALGDVAAAGAEDEAQSKLRAAQQAAAGGGQPPPCSPPEVSSQPREEGADNFPGFWRPPASGSDAGEAGPAGNTRAARKRAADGPAGSAEPPQWQQRRQQRQQQEPHPAEERQEPGGGDEQSPLQGQGSHDRRVRFCVPEPEPQAAEEQLAAPPTQEPAGPTPLVVAPPVLPSAGGRGAGGVSSRPSTPAKPVALRMPQPPAYSRFGAASFHKPYVGPHSRRQALLSFVSEGGATCFALPPVPPAPAAGGDGGDAAGGADCRGDGETGAAAAAGEDGVVIPRRLQHRQGLGRRLSLQQAPPSPQGSELLAQEVREAYMHARLADHAGEPWARLDLAGCELKPGSGHAEALQQLSERLEERRGVEATKQLLSQLEGEWQHLRRVRQKYVGGAAASAAPAAAPSATEQQDAARSPAGDGATAGSAEEAARPRGILKHRSSFNGSSQPPSAAAAAAADGPQLPEQRAEQAANGDVGAASFEAILAADIVSEPPLPAADMPCPAGADAAAAVAEAGASDAAADATAGKPASTAVAAAAGGEQPAAVEAVAAGSVHGKRRRAAEEPCPMDVDEGAMPAAPVLTDAPADTAAEPPVAEQRPPAATEAEAATRAPVPVPEGTAGPAAPEAPLPADAEGVQPEQQGEDLEAAADVLLSPLEPRPVELTPGPSLSRGAKLLQRVGTPVAAGKLQQLLAGSACDQGRKQGALFPSPGALQPAGGSGGPGPRHGVRRMSRGERLLAALKHGGGGGGPHSSPAACPPADEAATEDGPTLAPAAAVLLS